VSAARISAILLRIARQFRRDRRTLALVFFVPMFILGLLGYLTNLSPSGTRLTVVAVNEVNDAAEGRSLATSLLEQVRSSVANELLASEEPEVEVLPVEELGLDPTLELAPGVLATSEGLIDSIARRVKSGDLDGALLLRARAIVPVELPAPTPPAAPGGAAPAGYTMPPAAAGRRALVDRVELSVGLIVEGSTPAVTGATIGAARAALAALGPAAIEAYRDLWGEHGTPLLQALDETGFAAGGTGDLDVTYVHGGEDFGTLDYYGPVFIPFFAFFLTFLLSMVGLLRERAQGTMERVLASPLGPAEILVGYIGGYMLFALLQCLVVVLFVVYGLGVHYEGGLGAIFVITALLAVVAVNIGCALSAYASTELQAIQFIPVVVVPQALLGDVIWRVADMPPLLQSLAYLMPLTYASRALRAVMVRGDSLLQTWPQIAALCGFALVMYVIAWATLVRQKKA